MECNQKENLKDCFCSYPDCPRKGFCCQCIRYHRAKNELPGCYFSSQAEKSYDRSINNFIKDQQNK